MARYSDEYRLCAHCDERPAACIGSYEGSNRWELACDECCGHGCEDGKCYQLVQVPELLDRLAELHAAAASKGTNDDG